MSVRYEACKTGAVIYSVHETNNCFRLCCNSSIEYSELAPCVRAWPCVCALASPCVRACPPVCVCELVLCMCVRTCPPPVCVCARLPPAYVHLSPVCASVFDPCVCAFGPVCVHVCTRLPPVCVRAELRIFILNRF